MSSKILSNEQELQLVQEYLNGESVQNLFQIKGCGACHLVEREVVALVGDVHLSRCNLTTLRQSHLNGLFLKGVIHIDRNEAFCIVLYELWEHVYVKMGLQRILFRSGKGQVTNTLPSPCRPHSIFARK